MDPSCSGSGIASRMDKFVDEEQETDAEKQRLESLAKFQLSILNHALSFPSVRRVVYSTCSIHQEENEDVVEAALKANNDRFTLEHCLPSWTHRGKNVFQGAEKCVRASPDEDSTNGFFVALFARKTSESGNTEKLHKDSRKGRKRNLNSEDEETNIPAAKLDQEMNKAQLPLNKENDQFESNGEHLPSQNKRRKKNRKSKESKSQELQVIVPKIAKTGSNNVKKKRKPKKKNKKVPVCS